MPSLHRLAAAGLLAVATVASASACASGGSGSSPLAGMSADQIVQKSVGDLKAASSVRITGTLDDSGQGVTLDLTDVAAQGCQGSITLAAASAAGRHEMSGTADIIVADGAVYMRLDRSFFTSAGLPAAAYSDVVGQYIKLSAKSNLVSFAQLCNPSTLSAAFAKEDTGFVASGSATVNRQPATAFRQPKNTSNGTVYISQSATPEILRIVGPARQGSVYFSGYNARATITAPPAGETVGGSQFGL